MLRPISILLVVIDVCSVLFVVTLYRFSSIEGLMPFLGSLPGMLCLAAAFLLATSTVWLVGYLRGLPAGYGRQARLLIAMNIITVIAAAAVGEVALRVVHEIVMRQPALHIAEPMMRSWGRTSEQFRAELDKHDPDGPYHEFDPILGWRIGRNRHSTDGLYASSLEGLRSSKPGEPVLTWSVSDPIGVQPRRTPFRIALLGDSYTFGYRVAYEDSWASLIKPRLGARFHVVNFGVIGYSVNQARLKYERDVRPSHPDIVVLSVISHDFVRDGFIYNFLPYPDMLALPYARPRPVVRDGHLSLLNTPLPSPDTIFAQRDVHALPFLEYDINYNASEWERGSWRLLQRSFLFRALTSWSYSPPQQKQNAFAVEIRRLGQQIIKDFVDAVRRDGALPLLVYLPDRRDLEPSTIGRSAYRILPAPRFFQEAGLEYIDATPCILAVPPERRFLEDNHYTVEANRALASCLPKMILTRLPVQTAMLANP
ncbi:hypothetical protein W02_40260 [Nitrospira sp. KM1]|uniref:SGNH/GDSL hydrolase family protein n=1 Tax=Nitrospira sp. KM1 TaxID=1936990 RepID=UPI0013A70EEC|nr:SGNH/GDSL hydrolase family protein [Nitrospira sp. KM1]BCA56886.1 hypothetical protein W02_40260 [Nitrospira sp. KM1]